ncbi:hypothetical protein CEUSTIGMA_g1576.t1 [Chlamydomonas eustigma]|uniref:2Fe-2S ferredoxin-type domain-containing protein n=1 Tax=Chlamydomonas eustigma TaxID=1157962 RepID=A0A250WTH5_9CHLO|nr:hypothetical protein CEUSTIGMA_g1576.t1 [Chlamydomonas eustigma]|eukprot:GAX74127.1 hypothetical protein CEUSTIGMA_g1576.t1 [Chlamydomonas eustigma]
MRILLADSVNGGTQRSMSLHRPFTTMRPIKFRPTLPAVRTAAVYKVEIEHLGKSYSLDVPEGESILSVARDKYKLNLPHDCNLGVCMTCPAKMISGKVDQSGSMLSEDVADKGYALLCVAIPQSDCKLTTISEEELLEQQFG